MISTRCRWRPWAVGAAAGIALAACAAPGTQPPAATGGAPAIRTATLASLPTGTLRSDAVAATAALRSYTFSSEQLLAGGSGTPTSTITGRVTLPETVHYTLILGGRREEVVRLPGVTYLRTLPGSWHRLTHTVPAPNPLTSLLGVLRGLTRLVVLPAGQGAAIRGELPWTAARRAGLVTAATGPDLPVTVDLDAAHRVTEFKLTMAVTLHGHLLRAVQLTRFGAFNAVPRITAPAG